MSIFTKIGGAIMGPLIRREIRKIMKEFIQPILDLVTKLVQPSQGTKFLITLAGFAVIFYLKKAGIGDSVTIIVVGSMVIVYYLADLIGKREKKEETK